MILTGWACFSLLMPTGGGGGGGEGKMPFGERRRKTAKLERGVRRASVMQKVKFNNHNKASGVTPANHTRKRERERAMQEEAE